MEQKLLIAAIIGTLVCSHIAVFYWGMNTGSKYRPVYIDAGKINYKLPDLFQEAGVSYTDDQLKAIYKKMNTEKEAIGFVK